MAADDGNMMTCDTLDTGPRRRFRSYNVVATGSSGCGMGSYYFPAVIINTTSRRHHHHDHGADDHDGAHDHHDHWDGADHDEPSHDEPPRRAPPTTSLPRLTRRRCRPSPTPT